MNRVAAEFLAKAEADFATAQRELAATTRPNPDAVCFHAQQAIEKLLKAILVQRNQPFPKTHDLQGLVTLLVAAGFPFTGQVADLLFLQPGAVDYRYPGQSASAQDAADALAAAERLWRTLRPLI